jgi:hypothetical protein
MEAYVGIAEGLNTYEKAHARANEFFGNVQVIGPEPLPKGAESATSGRAEYNFRRIGVKVTIEKNFFSPQPAADVPNTWERTRGHIKVVDPKEPQKPAQEKKP